MYTEHCKVTILHLLLGTCNCLFSLTHNTELQR